MRLDKLVIKNFRKLKDCTISFRDVTFLIGSNNAGKSSVFKALEYLHTQNNVVNDDYSKYYDSENDNIITVPKIEIIGEYHNVPAEANSWVGFKGRVIINDDPKMGESPYKILYRKVWKHENSKPEIYLKEYTKIRTSKYKSAKNPHDLINLGLDEELVIRNFGEEHLETPFVDKKINDIFKYFPELWDLDTQSDTSWIKNPGGIPAIVQSKLPILLIIPAESGITELTSSNGALTKTLLELFEDVRRESSNYNKAQTYLSELAKEMDPKNSKTKFGKLISELNTITHSIFPNTSIHISANLDDANKTIKPLFEVEMESNVKTSVNYQGHGMIRTTVFQLLRFIQNLKSQSERGSIICFEEPEMFLHPAAANQLRDALYDFANDNQQIIVTTHSPYMINLGAERKISLTKFSITENQFSETNSFNLEKAFLSLIEDEKQYLKFLLKFDDYISRLFFTNKTIFVEGDTEEVVIRETIKRLKPEDRAIIIGNCEVLRARGKPVLVSLGKYLNTLNINYIFMHDRDKGVEKAEQVNDSILKVTGPERRVLIEECIENILGYTPPGNEKPFKAFEYINNNWPDEFISLPIEWKDIFIKLFSPYLDHLSK